MGKNSNSVSDSETTVFIDTSLGTHLAIPVDQNDTVSALKAKIENEHQFCFTSMGKIKVEALKVERKGYFYHLSDSMLVKSAFIGVNEIWFISADASHVPGKKLSIFDDSMTLLLEGKKCEQDKVTISEHNGSFDSARETSKELEIGFRHSDKDLCRTSVHEKIDRPEPEMQEDPNLCTGRFPTTQEWKEDSSRKGSDVSCNASFGKDLPAQDKRQSKIKQKIKETVHSKEHDVFSYGYGKQKQQPDITPPGNSLVNQTRDVSFDIKIGKETTSTRDVLCDMATGNNSTTKETSRSSNSRIHVTDDTSKATEVPGEHVKNRKNISVEDAPKSQTASLKKRKFESVADVEDSLKENNVLVGGSSNGTSKPEIALELALGAKQINANDLLGGLTAKSSDLLSNGASQRKTKKRKKTSNAVNQVVSAAPSGRDVMEQSSMVSGARIDENSDGKDDAAETMSAKTLKENNVLVGGSNNGTSKPEIALELALGAKQINANDLVGGLIAESSDLLSNSASKGKTKKRKKTSNAVNQVASAAPSGRDVMEESSMVSGAGISEKNSDGKDDAASISGHSLQGIMPPESGRTEGRLDSCPSVAVEVPNGGGTNSDVRVGDERESSQIKDSDANDTKVIVTSELQDANGTVGPDNKSKKKRKSKKSNGSIGESQIKSGTEHIKGSEHGILSQKTHDAVHCEHAGHKVKEAESDLSQSNGKDLSEKESQISHSVMRTDNVDSIGKPQTNEESRKKNMKNKSKRIHSAGTTKATDMQAEAGIAGPQDPALTTENGTEVGNARRNSKSEKSSPIAQVNWKAHECDKDYRIAIDSIPAQSNSMVAESSKVPYHAMGHTPEKKFPKKVPSKAPSLDMSGKMNSKSQAAGKQRVASVSGNNTHAGKKNEAFAVSSSNLAKSNNKSDRGKITNKSKIGVGRNRIATTKASSIDHGEVVNSSATPKAIFKDDSSGSSEDEDEGGISEASTDAPSDYSLSSGYSEGESKLDMDSPRNGKAGNGSVNKSCSSDIKNMNWLELAKNSSTFKKAKLTASQSELEDEIQPLDADSQPIL